MLAISHCPRCEGQVTLPEGLEAEAVVRCPLCQAEFEMGEVLAHLPPMLVLVSRPQPAAALADTAPATDGEPWEQAVSEAGAVEAGLDLPPAAAVAEVGIADDSDEAGLDTLEHGEVEEADMEEEETYGLREESSRPETAAAAATTDFSSWQQRGAAERTRKSQSEKGIVRHALEVAGGGLLGLLIGYYVLNFLGGERFDFLEVPLPGVAHTSAHWSRWFPGRAAEDLRNGVDDEGTDEEGREPGPSGAEDAAPAATAERADKYGAESRLERDPIPETADESLADGSASREAVDPFAESSDEKLADPLGVIEPPQIEPPMIDESSIEPPMDKEPQIDPPADASPSSDTSGAQSPDVDEPAPEEMPAAQSPSGAEASDVPLPPRPLDTAEANGEKP